MSTNAARFGQIVKDRRLELDLNQLEVHAAGGPSNSKLTEIENGRLDELTRQTARKLDEGLRWKPGSARTTWQGGDPTPLDGAADGRLEAELAALREAVRAARERGVSRDDLLQMLDSETG